MKRFFPLFALLLLPVLTGCGAARPFVTNHSADLSDNYLRDIVPARWERETITYRIDPQRSSIPGLYMPRLAERALHYWDAAIAPAKLVKAGEGEAADIEISWKDRLWFAVETGGAIGWTDPPADPANPTRLKSAHSYILRSLDPIKMEACIMHEAGHALGIQGHSRNYNDLMALDVPSPGKIRKRDFNTMASIYRRLSAAK